MKNKFFKTLACIGLCAVSALGLVGCSMTADQQKALDAVVDSADSIVEALDKNLEMQNKSLSKEEAAEKLNFANLRFLRADYDALQMKNLKYNRYEGYFIKPYGNSKEISYDATIYKKDGLILIYLVSSDGEQEQVVFQKWDIANNKWTYVQKHPDGTVSDDSLDTSYKDTDSMTRVIGTMYNPITLIQSISQNFGTKIYNFTADNIQNIEVLEDGYKFTIIDGSFHKSNYIFEENVYEQNIVVWDYTLKGNYVTAIDVKLYSALYTEVDEDKLEKDANGKIVTNGWGMVDIPSSSYSKVIYSSESYGGKICYNDDVNMREANNYAESIASASNVQHNKMYYKRTGDNSYEAIYFTDEKIYFEASTDSLAEIYDRIDVLPAHTRGESANGSWVRTSGFVYIENGLRRILSEPAGDSDCLEVIANADGTLHVYVKVANQKVDHGTFTLYTPAD